MKAILESSIANYVPVIGCSHVPKFHLLAAFLFAFQIPADAAAVAMLQVGDVFGDTLLFLLCVIGASGGAYCAVFCFPPRESKLAQTDSANLRLIIRRLCAKFGFSMIGSTTLTPMLMQILSIDSSRTMVVGCSSVVAFLIVVLIHFVASLIDRSKTRRVVNINVTGPVNQLGGEIDNE